jgi:hypothetical protein
MVIKYNDWVLTESMDHYTMHQSDKVRICWDGGCTESQLTQYQWRSKLTQRQSQAIRPLYTKRPFPNMPTCSSAPFNDMQTPYRA